MQQRTLYAVILHRKNKPAKEAKRWTGGIPHCNLLISSGEGKVSS